MNFTFSSAAQYAIEQMENPHKNFFITGKAGTGKSTLLEHIRLRADKKMVVLAPTGVAAINVGGETIHSFFKLKPGAEIEEASRIRIDEKKKAKYLNLKTILIDEISMVRADLLDAVDIFLRRARDCEDPFGGCQMIFFGDLFQLPPVVTNADKTKFYQEYTSPYFFSAQVFTQRNLLSEPFRMETIELEEIYRQSDERFIHLLNAIRDNSATPQDLEALNARVDPDFIPPEGQSYIYLMATNRDATLINQTKLQAIKEDPITFTAEKKGKINQSLHPNDTSITVKIGAQVMFIQNDAQRRWVNGTLGVVESSFHKFNEETNSTETLLMVRLENGKVVEVAPYVWEISKYNFKNGAFSRELIGSFTQIPLRLAWAITIHKSQGKSFDQVVIDLGWGSFAHGQTYVALSRCTSLEGLILKKPIKPTDIIVDESVRQNGSDGGEF